MPNLEHLEYWREVGKKANDLLPYYEKLFAEENFQRPETLGKVKVWPSAKTYDATILPTEALLEQFQEFLDVECTKPEFGIQASCVPGKGPVPFLNGKFRVSLFSRRTEKWIEVAYAEVS